MLRYAVRRLALALPLSLGVATLVFALMETAPGNPADLMLGVVQANKALHVHTLEAAGLPHSKIRMIYVEGLPMLPADAPEQELEFRHMGKRPGPDRTYTLAQVRRSIAGEPVGTPLRICFSC